MLKKVQGEGLPDTDSERDDDSTELNKKNLEDIDEKEGVLSKQQEKDKLMNSVLENDQEKIDEGKMISESINRGMGAFNPDIMMKDFTKNFSMAKQLIGDSIIRQLSGYDPEYIEKNIKIPEFKKELKKKVDDKIKSMKKNKLLDKEGKVTNLGLEFAAIINYMEELDNITPKGIRGERIHKRPNIHGDRDETRDYRKGDMYKDIAIKKTIKKALRRNHSNITTKDIIVHERKSKGKINIIYAMDASGSMKGNRISTAKRAGIALAHKAISKNDKVGLIVFNDDILKEISPTDKMGILLEGITNVKANRETNIVKMINTAIRMFPKTDATKHLIILTDAVPTKGEDPETETLEAVAKAAKAKITTSILGIQLDKKGAELAKKICNISRGRFYVADSLENVDKIILQDYSAIM